MIYGQLAAPDTYRFLLGNPAWKLAFDWLKTVGPTTALGIQKLQGDDMYANVMTYETVDRSEARFESHRRYVDLQYCITGGEIINWELSSNLRCDGPYTDSNDLQFYLPAATATAVHLNAGAFGIYFPCDAHRPKCRDGVNASTYKLVVKVAYHLVSSS